MKILNNLFFYLLTLCASFESVAQSSTPVNENIDHLPSLPFLPDPLITDESFSKKPVTTKQEWEIKRQWIKEQYQHWITGTRPPAPDTFTVKIINERKESTILIRLVDLHFGQGLKGKLRVELIIPPSAKKLPVLVTQWNHRSWAQIAVRRGYIGCVYAGADARDDSQNFSELYPGYSFSTLMKRAWMASRAVDYLYTLNEVDTARIGITGHSRNAKQSLMAAAFDERIKAVVSSSGGTGGEVPFRFTDDPYDNESIDDITKNFPDWFHPRLKMFIGKEQKLPVDQNSLMALIAPRGLMLSAAITEEESNPWSIEQAFNASRKVFSFLQADNKLGLLFRNGRHGTSTRDIENYIDFFDYVFGRSATPPENRLFYNYSFPKWVSDSGEQLDTSAFQPISQSNHLKQKHEFSIFREHVRSRIKWILGEEPPGISSTGMISIEKGNLTGDYLAEVIQEPAPLPGIKKIILGPYNAPGEYLWADLYFPEDIQTNKDLNTRKLPLVIFLHEYSHNTGYRRRCESIITEFSKKGFIVLAFDMIGFGTRIEEYKNFYARYPNWSIMGKMVSDTRLLINDAFTRMPFVDTSNVFLSGYSLGGTVALLTAALDNRVKGTAVISAFDSWRITDAGSEGIKHFSHVHGLIPKLGFFVNNENHIPVDFAEILSAIAPRFLYVIAPTQDRHHPKKETEDVAKAVSKTFNLLHAPSGFTFKQPETYSHFTEVMQKEIAAWMLKVKGMRTVPSQ